MTKFIAQAGRLATAAKVAAGVVDAKTAKRIKVLGAVLIDAGNPIRIVGTDLDQAAIAAVAGIIEEVGRVAVSAEAFSRLVASIAPDVEVTIAASPSGLRITAGRARYRLPMLPEAEFPAPPASTAAADLVLTRDQVGQLLGATRFAICHDDTRHYLSGSYLHRDADGHLCCVATDGHLLSLASSTIVPTSDMLPAAGAIVPAKTVDNIVGLTADTIALRIDTKVIEARTNNILISGKTINATYPAYTGIVPPKGGAVAELQREAFVAAVERMRAAMLAIGKPRTVTVTWDSGGAVKLWMDTVELAEDSLPAVTHGHAEIKLAIDRLATVIDAFGGDSLVLGFTSSTQPLRFHIAGADDRIVVLAPCVT